MITIRVPQGMDPNDFCAAVRAIEPSGLSGIPEDDGTGYVVRWDERIAPAPTEQDLVSAAKASSRARKVTEAFDEASRRRQAVLDAVTPGGLADYVSLMGRALAGVRREAKGRADPDEIARLNALEALADQIEAIDTARDTIISEIRQHPDPASYDVPGSPHWP